MKQFISTLLFFLILQSAFSQTKFPILELSKNSLNYKGFPKNATDRKSLAFSDKGAWFGFGFLEPGSIQGGFSGPFLMTEQNGVWLSSSFVSLRLLNDNKQDEINWEKSLVNPNSYNSH